MTAVEDFIYEYESSQRDVMFYLHHLLTDELHLIPKIRYQIPFYYRKSWVCYLNPTKNGTVEFAFPRGNELSNVQELLESRGRKQVMSMEIENVKGMQLQTIREILQEAILLDVSVPYASKRKK